MPSHASRLHLPIVLLLFMLPLRASADTQSCTDAHASGQRAENAGHLKEALASFQDCASDDPIFARDLEKRKKLVADLGDDAPACCSPKPHALSHK